MATPTVTITRNYQGIEGTGFFTTPTNNVNSNTNYVSGGGGSGSSSSNAVLLQGNQSYIWGKKGWRNNATFHQDVSFNGPNFYVLGSNGGYFLHGLRSIGVCNFESDVNIGQALSVDGQLFGTNGEFSSDVSVGGVLRAETDVSIGNDLYVEGDIFIGGTGALTLTDLTVTNDVSISNDLYVDGNIYGDFVIDTSVFSTLTVENDTSIGGDLYVSGTSNLNILDANSGDIATLGTTNLTVATKLTSPLAEFTNLNVSNDTSIGNDLYVGGDMNVTGALNLKSLIVDTSITVDYLESNDIDVDNIIINTHLTGVDASLTGDLYVGGTINGGNLVFNFKDLQDVDITSAAAGDVFRFDTDASTVINEQPIDLADASVAWDNQYTTNYQYMGDPAVDGSWRFFVDQSTNLRFEKKVSGVWTYKDAIV